MKCGSLKQWGGLALVCALMSGCATPFYVTRLRSAEENFEEAKKLEAERYAPYEFYAAEARLNESRRLASEAEYGTALTLAEQAEDLAKVAVQHSRDARNRAPEATK